jgi:hypothetical protein
MVLHNDKWKYKAKKAVERKHAKQAKKSGGNTISNTTPTTTVNDSYSDDDRDKSDTDSSENENDDDDDDADADTNKSFAKAKKVSNAWRFTDPIVDESILKDPEYVAQLNAIKEEDENRLKFMRNIVSEKLKSDDFKENEDVFNKSKILKSFRKMKTGTLDNWTLNNDHSDEDFNEDSANPKIREFTEEEKNNFLKLQQKINHKKEINELKSRMDKINNRGEKTKVLEIHSNVGKDNYKNIVDQRLQKANHKTSSDELDSLIEEVLGVNLKDTSKKPETSQDFDLDSLIGAPIKTTTQRNITPSNTSRPTVVLDDEDEEFLDSIL